MCLYVKEKVSGTSAIIKKCFKHMQRISLQHNWLTPYRYAAVSNDGVLFCEDSVLRHSTINGNYIHAYQYVNAHDIIDQNDYNKYFDAYAINVKALGNDDLACKLLYIPELDTVNNSKHIQEELEKVILNPNWQDIHKLFPNHLRSLPLIEKIDWDKVFREMFIWESSFVSHRCDSDQILAKIPRSQTAISYLNKLSYKNFMNKFKRAYNAKRSKAIAKKML